MITPEMYKLLERRQFADATRERKPQRKRNHDQIRRMFELMEQGKRDQEIADLLGMNHSSINYHRKKLRSVQP